MYMYEHSLQFLWLLQTSNYSTNIINSFRRGVLDTTLCDKVCLWLAGGRWFSLGPPVSSTNKVDRHDILVTELLLKVALNTITISFQEWILKFFRVFSSNNIHFQSVSFSIYFNCIMMKHSNFLSEIFESNWSKQSQHPFPYFWGLYFFIKSFEKDKISVKQCLLADQRWLIVPKYS